jgi:hypothetical protein
MPAQPSQLEESASMQLADIEPGLHLIWDDSPSAATRENIVQRIDAFHHRKQNAPYPT